MDDLDDFEVAEGEEEEGDYDFNLEDDLEDGAALFPVCHVPHTVALCHMQSKWRSSLVLKDIFKVSRQLAGDDPANSTALQAAGNLEYSSRS